MTHARTFGILITLFVTGCSGHPATRSSAPPGNPRLITGTQIEQSYARDAYELVSRLRPNWIAPRGPQSFQDPTAGQVNVYMEGVRIGGAEMLRRLRVDGISSIEYLNEIDAAARFGSVARGGSAILIRPRVGPDR